MSQKQILKSLINAIDEMKFASMITSTGDGGDNKDNDEEILKSNLTVKDINSTKQ